MHHQRDKPRPLAQAEEIACIKRHFSPAEWVRYAMYGGLDVPESTQRAIGAILRHETCPDNAETGVRGADAPECEP